MVSCLEVIQVDHSAQMIWNDGGRFGQLKEKKPPKTLAIFKITEQTTTLEGPGFHKKTFLKEEKLPVHC